MERQARAHPPGFKKKLLPKEIDVINDFLKVYETELQRGNKFFLDWKLSKSIVSLCKIILILNDKYPVSWKWITKEVMGLKYTPADLREREIQIVNGGNSTSDYKQRIEELRTLVEETVDKTEGKYSELLKGLRKSL